MFIVGPQQGSAPLPAWSPSLSMAGGLLSDRGDTRYRGNTVGVLIQAPAPTLRRAADSSTRAQPVLRQAQTARSLRERVRLQLHKCRWCLELIWTLYSHICDVAGENRPTGTSLIIEQ